MELEKTIELFLGEFIPTTRTSYTFPLRLMCGWIGATKDLAAVKPEMLIEYFQMVITPRNYAAATHHKHVKTIKTFFNWCVKMELLDKSPAKVIKNKRLRTAIGREKAMTDAELRALLEVTKHKPRDYALILFLADTGCRAGGVAGLRMEDMDWSTLTAKVTEKGNKERKVAFGDACAKAIRGWLGFRSQRYKITGVYVFTRNGEKMSARNVSLMIRRSCKVAGIRVRSAHSLRHRKGHQLSDAGISPSVGAIVLGHEDPKITLEHYYRKDWDSAEKAFRQLTTDPEKPVEQSKKIIRFSG